MHAYICAYNYMKYILYVTLLYMFDGLSRTLDGYSDHERMITHKSKIQRIGYLDNSKL